MILARRQVVVAPHAHIQRRGDQPFGGLVGADQQGMMHACVVQLPRPLKGAAPSAALGVGDGQCALLGGDLIVPQRVFYERQNDMGVLGAQPDGFAQLRGGLRDAVADQIEPAQHPMRLHAFGR